MARRSPSPSRCAVANELILIVEDNDKNRKLMRDVLQDHGIPAIRDDPATETIPVIAVTASAMTLDLKTIMAAGFEDYLSKPISAKAFLDTRHTLDECHK